MHLFLFLFFYIIQEKSRSQDFIKDQIICTTSKNNSVIKVLIDWSKLRSFWNINGADYFDARQENNAIDFNLKMDSQKEISIKTSEGFSYYNLENNSIVVGLTDLNYRDKLNLEVYFHDLEIMKGNIFLSNEKNLSGTNEEVNCKKITIF